MLDQLKDYLRNLSASGIALAFSGGTDSTLLLKVLSELHKENLFSLTALTMRTLLQDGDEMKEAQELAEQWGVEHKFVSFNPFSVEEVKNNRADRCYHCKRKIFGQFFDFAQKYGLKYVLDGTNADDLKVFRPGRQALQELGVISPFAELGINKTQIREMSAMLELPTARKPAIPCLATRFAYNTKLDDKRIAAVAAVESWLKVFLPEVDNLRLRVQGDLVRLEVEKEFIPVVAGCADEVVNGLKKFGFHYITLDLQGFRSGSFDETLQHSEKIVIEGHNIK